MTDEETLRESISRLEQALAVEHRRNEEVEAMLAGIRCVLDAPDLAATDEVLLQGLQPLFHYRAAALFLRSADDPELFSTSATNLPALARLRWRSGPLLTRVLAGQTVALFDVQRVPELAPLADVPGVRSALCIPLSIPERPAVLLGVHDEPAFFSPRHVALARGFSRTASRVLESFGTREHIQQLRLAEAQAATLTRANAALLEQLAVIQAQRQQIQRLSAPVVQVAPETLVVPLIGELDHDMLVRVTETLLHAIASRGARHVILDFTGFGSADLGIVARIHSLTRCAALLGASCRISGLHPQTALALGEAALDVPAHATLADALLALSRMTRH